MNFFYSMDPGFHGLWITQNKLTNTTVAPLWTWYSNSTNWVTTSNKSVSLDYGQWSLLNRGLSIAQVHALTRTPYSLETNLR